MSLIDVGNDRHGQKAISKIGRQRIEVEICYPTIEKHLLGDQVVSHIQNTAQTFFTISVIIPSYGRPHELSDLFESIMHQTVKPLEVIVVDDTPTKEIEETCQEWLPIFAELRAVLMYIRNPSQRSAATARNIGAGTAKGDIFAFIDSDIILSHRYFEKILEVFVEYRDAIAVQGWIGDHEEEIPRFWYRIVAKVFGIVPRSSVNSCRLWERPSILTKITSCEWLGAGSTAVKREAFEKGFRFDEKLKKYSYMEDVLFSHSIYREYAGGLYLTPSAKYVHRLSKEGREYDEAHVNNCRRYVLSRLLGRRGLLLYYRWALGLLLIDKIQKIWKHLDPNFRLAAKRFLSQSNRK